ncbi:hypothetical protein SLE2022_123510 [Rubroshorea leprosula]
MATNSDNSGAGGSGGGGGGGLHLCMTKYVDDGSVESYRYYLARKTVLEMLKDRGYDVTDSEATCSLAAFRAVFGDKPEPESLRLCFPHPSNSSKKILVVFMGTVEIRVPTIRALSSQIVGKESLNGLILILQSKMNSFARKEIEKQFSFKVEIFQITDLLVNISKHFLVPTHEILSSEEKKELLKKHQLDDKQLPQLLQTDPIAKYYGLEKGQVVKLTYPEELVKNLVIYRCVV